MALPRAREDVDDFLLNITHELKTPLTSIKMYGELMAMGKLKTDEKRRGPPGAHRPRERAAPEAIDDILDFARLDSGQKQFVLAEEDVADTVAEALDLFRHSARVQGFDLFVEDSARGRAAAGGPRPRRAVARDPEPPQQRGEGPPARAGG